MSEITRLETNARMSQAVVYNQVAYLAGQVSHDKSLGVKEQTQNALAEVDRLLKSVGSDRGKLLSATVYLKTMADFADMNQIWDAWIPAGASPARACVEAKMADPGYLVEIMVIAAV